MTEEFTENDLLGDSPDDSGTTYTFAKVVEKINKLTQRVLDRNFEYHNVVSLNSSKYIAFDFYLDEAETEEYKVTVCFDYSGAGQHLCVTTGRRMNLTYLGVLTQTSTTTDSLQSGSGTTIVQSYRASAAVSDLPLFPSDIDGYKIEGELLFTGYGGDDNFFARVKVSQIRQDADEYDIAASLEQIHKQS